MGEKGEIKINISQEGRKLIRDFSEAIKNDNAAIFIGAGLSREAGYLGWSEFLKTKATDIGLDVEKEKNDLISLAQYYINKETGGRNSINSAIQSCFNNKKHTPTENHKLLASLPIKNYWTTNYDDLIERTFLDNDIKKAVVKSDKDLILNTDNVRVIIHKMHGDAGTPNEAVISKADYESYYDKWEMMLAKFKGEMCSKTFLFLGYSFSDHNIHHILARIRKAYDSGAKKHYCIMRRVQKSNNEEIEKDYTYNTCKQDHQVKDFERYGIKVILVDKHEDTTAILEEIRKCVYMKNVAICGSISDEDIEK
jgi:hypothetical protein